MKFAGRILESWSREMLILLAQSHRGSLHTVMQGSLQWVLT